MKHIVIFDILFVHPSSAMRNVSKLLNRNHRLPLQQASRCISNSGLKQSYNGRDTNDQDELRSNKRRMKLVIYSAFGIASLVATKSYKRVLALSKDGEVDETLKNVKIYTRKDVAFHDSLEKGVWITYQGKVYDITEFIKHHPGGTHTIMMGAGGDVEPFWKTYTVHEAIEVQNLLSKYQIGILTKEEHLDLSAKQTNQEGPYANDPIRSPLLKVLTKEPFNAETPPKLLTETPITPTEIFFVRNHLPVPEVDIEDYKLGIYIGSDSDSDSQKLLKEFTLDELKREFKSHTIESVIQCSGNRRSDLKRIKEIKGLNWGVGAIGNAKWTGVKLVDVLKSLDKELDKQEEIKHVQFEGLDCDMSGQAYGASISSDVALDQNKNVLIAFEMNDKPLTRDHGFPLRLVAPGITGARNVKWLAKIILSHEESNSHWQRNDYKSFSPNADMFNLDYKQSISIQEMPVQSAICSPVNDEKITLKPDVNCHSIILPVRGYAYSGGGKMIVRVDVSIDGGSSWMTADLIDIPRLENGLPDYSNRNKVGSWTRWSLELPISAELVERTNGTLEILCRAFDASYNSQPERAETVWNARGVVNNSWHKIKLNIKLS